MDALAPFISEGDEHRLVNKLELLNVIEVAKEVKLMPDKKRRDHTVTGVLRHLQNEGYIQYKTVYKNTLEKKNSAHYEIRRNEN